MVDTVWFFVVVIALAGAPAIACIWWLGSSSRRDARKARAAERFYAAYEPANELELDDEIRSVAHHDGPCDCWEDTDVLLLRDSGFDARTFVPAQAGARVEPAPASSHVPALVQIAQAGRHRLEN